MWHAYHDSGLLCALHGSSWHLTCFSMENSYWYGQVLVTLFLRHNSCTFICIIRNNSEPRSEIVFKLTNDTIEKAYIWQSYRA